MTMKKMSRILSVFLALALLCSLCAVTPVFAEEGTASDSTPTVAEPQPQAEEPLAGNITEIKYESYAIGTKEGGEFTSQPDVLLYTTGLTIRVYFAYKSDSDVGDVPATMTAGSFVQQGEASEVYKLAVYNSDGYEHG